MSAFALVDKLWLLPGVAVNLTLFLNMLGALLLGLLVGYERSYHGRAAGMRTYGMVCMASCALTVLCVYPQHWLGDHSLSSVDPTRVIQGVVTGIGFLGAGLIMKDGMSISGLTTAASIWASSAIGVLVGVGFYGAAVLLSLADSSQEAQLRRQVAQATKMQAVGQLAGGVAHDFNNVLTAIIGTCDLMLLRHIPGDSDYDDIQQIRANSNRAAALTRQLLAFSRQQTLRPEIIQLPDVVSEVSPLIKRLLGEKITYYVQHDRNLGPVRADPQQLEQVIVNLAVNARDAMGGAFTAKDFRTWGGTLMAFRRFAAMPLPEGRKGGEPSERALSCVGGHPRAQAPFSAR